MPNTKKKKNKFYGNCYRKIVAINHIVLWMCHMFCWIQKRNLYILQKELHFYSNATRFFFSFQKRYSILFFHFNFSNFIFQFWFLVFFYFAEIPKVPTKLPFRFPIQTFYSDFLFRLSIRIPAAIISAWRTVFSEISM